MSTEIVPAVGHRGRSRRSIRGIVAAVGGVAALSLAGAAPASAAPEAIGSVAPIGSGGAYLVTLKNTGTELIPTFLIGSGETATGIVPSPACVLNTPFSGAIACNSKVAPGATAQVCYVGSAPGVIFPDGSSAPINLYVYGESASSLKGIDIAGLSPAVASCPLPGFNPNPVTTAPGITPTPLPGTTPAATTTPPSGSKTTVAFTSAQCKGAAKAWSKKHRHATHKQKKAEAKALHKAHGCSLSLLK